MKYFTYQGSNHDCGFAGLKMLLANLSNNKGYLHLKKEGRKDNYSFLDLIKIASEHGLTLKAYKYATSEVNEIKTPFLALIDENHLVLVKENKRGKYLIYDPGKGIYKMKHSEFDQVWTGKTLEVVDYVKQDYHQKANRIMPIKTNLISLAISIVSLAAILVGFFFVKEDAYFFIPIICLAIFSISELVDNWYLIKELNFFDKKSAHIRMFLVVLASNNDALISVYFMVYSLFLLTVNLLRLNVIHLKTYKFASR